MYIGESQKCGDKIIWQHLGLKSHDISYWLHITFGFDVVSLVELVKPKLEVDLFEIRCLFNKVLEFVVEDYAMLQESCPKDFYQYLNLP